MKLLFSVAWILWAPWVFAQSGSMDSDHYLDEIKAELKKEWPKNQTINLVFHGHSVPAGYFKTPVVNTLEAYPFQLLKLLKEHYPYAVINCITTALGGENARSGAKRFAEDVVPLRPKVVFIDYALNDRGIGLTEAKKAWESMIEEALSHHSKVVLLTPSPDQRVDIRTPGNELEQHALQIRALAKKYQVGLVDTYLLFQEAVKEGNGIVDYMSQVNHPNARGHALIANSILRYFE